MRTLNAFLRCELQPTAFLNKINQACFIGCIVVFTTAIIAALVQA